MTAKASVMTYGTYKMSSQCPTLVETIRKHIGGCADKTDMQLLEIIEISRCAKTPKERAGMIRKLCKASK